MSTSMSPEAAAGLLSPDDTLGVPLGPGVAPAFLHALASRDDWDQLQVFGALMPDLFQVFAHPGVHHLSGFYGPAERFWKAAGANIDFVPAGFRGFTSVLEGLAPRVMATAASPPDVDGWMSLSLHAGATTGELLRAGTNPDRLLIVETSPNFPRTHGLGPEHPHRIHVDQADVIVESDSAPLILEDGPATDRDRAIAGFAAAFIPDGATLQTGIGGIPSAVASLLAEGPGGDYGIHSEMFTTGLMHLAKAGKVSNKRKGIHTGYSVTTFAAGTQELYDWLDDNDEVRFLPVDIVNSPDVIARNDNMITINGAVAIDLAGQVVADTIGGTQFSGIGGHEDFIAGASLELSDRSLICLPAAVLGSDGQVTSRIVGRPPEGTIITTPRHQVDVVITEYGAAELAGRTVRERAAALADIAHPDVRDELHSVAAEWPGDGPPS